MKRKNRLIIFLISFGIICGWFYHESKYFNKVEFLSPINFHGDIPVRNDIYGSGEFGAKRAGKRIHSGLDILAGIGEPVRATRSGRVINAENHKNLGNYVEIRHGGGLISIYAHLSKILVEKGERVQQGQIIGEVGKSGNARYKKIKPHLHFEIRKNAEAINPRDCLEGARSVLNIP
jgi:murein DD-endopeptidase MepM/ murein hydrolase activator NlpD